MLSIEEKYLRLTVYAFYPLLLYVLRFTLFTGAHDELCCILLALWFEFRVSKSELEFRMSNYS